MFVNKKYKLKLTLALFFVISCEITTSDVPRPRGVSISRASLYAPNKNFVCLDGSGTIPYSQINDDYCDCKDGSDEPGTAACPNGVFHCTNAGHKPQNIPSSRVNDGICDCCDTSDEYAIPDSKCVNTCHELGRSARVEAQRRAELLKIGSQKRSELSQKGVLLKQEKKERFAELEKSKTEAERVKAEKEKIKSEVEELENAALEIYRKIENEAKIQKQEEENNINRKEASETFSRFDSNQDGKIQLAELQTRQTFDKDRNGEVSDEEAKFFLNEQDELELEDFINLAWPKIKPFLMIENGMFQAPAESNTEQKVVHEEDDMESPEIDEEEGEPESEEEAEEDIEEHKEEEDIKQEYDSETQKLVNEADEARNQFTQADRAVRDIQTEMNNIEEYLNKDYGSEEEFASLHGECFEYKDREYKYELCLFDRVTQQPHSGGAETRLGTWSKWAGPETNIYQQMLYDRGTSCWNGPQRTAKVHIECGVDNQILSVTEPNRCEYQVMFATPAACYDKVEKSSDQHDEL